MLVVSNISCSIMTLNLRPALFLNLNGTDDFPYRCPFIEINEPDHVFSCLYSIGGACIICRYAVFYILFAEFHYLLYMYIHILLL